MYYIVFDLFSFKQKKLTHINKHGPEKRTGGRVDRQVGKRMGMGIEHLRAVGNRWAWWLELMDSRVGSGYLSTQVPEFWREVLNGPDGGHVLLTTEKQDPVNYQTHQDCSLWGWGDN